MASGPPQCPLPIHRGDGWAGSPQPAGTGHIVLWSAWACKPRMVIESGQESLTGVVKRTWLCGSRSPAPLQESQRCASPGTVRGLGNGTWALSVHGWSLGWGARLVLAGGCPGGSDPVPTWCPGERGGRVVQPQIFPNAARMGVWRGQRRPLGGGTGLHCGWRAGRSTAPRDHGDEGSAGRRAPTGPREVGRHPPGAQRARGGPGQEPRQPG